MYPMAVFGTMYGGNVAVGGEGLSAEEPDFKRHCVELVMQVVEEKFQGS
jgi:hypothetical protein